MSPRLNKKELLDRLLRAVDESGWKFLVLSEVKPFHLRLFRGDDKGFDVRFYLWNCTHGGGEARASNEYRVQLTGSVPTTSSNCVTLLLGWHAGYEVFVGFDINKHDGQNSQSPSIQVKEEILQQAHNKTFSTYNRQSGEIAVAFRPELLVEYALNSKSLHAMGTAEEDLSLLSDLANLSESSIEKISDFERKIVISNISRKYRAADFRKRVLGAYQNRCAACGIQLELIDAAHIIPVAADESTDETNNGIALCKLHHEAYDRNLLSFDEGYKIELSSPEMSRLGNANLLGGIDDFMKSLLTAIILPSDRRDYPSPEYISKSRIVRKWQ